MEGYRSVVKVTQGKETRDGAGVKLVRVLGPSDTQDYDPFLMLDAFDSHNPADYIKGFPWHPHRGIETITYLIHGAIEHGDSLGNKGLILDGECQWMTAGSGIIHQEMPQASPRMLGCQLWLNLPAKDKMTDPAYGDIKAADVPIVTSDGVRVHIIAGAYQGRQGAFTGKYVKATYFDVELSAGHTWEYEDDPENTLFIYLFFGKVTFGGDDTTSPAAEYDAKQAVLFSRAPKLRIQAVEDARFILLSAKPLREPIAWGGPIVMNTREELRQAFRDLDNNTFIKKR